MLSVCRASLPALCRSNGFVSIRFMHNQFVGRKEKIIKERRRYALFGSVVMMYFGAHAVLLWRRRSEYRTMNKELPPISYEEFERNYLLAGKVRSIVLHPNFRVCDVYFVHEEGKSLDGVRKSMLQNKTIFGQKFYLKPDARFTFDEPVAVLERLIVEAQEKLTQPSEIELEVNSFPSYRELGFIVGSVLFGACCVGLMKF